MSSHTSLLHTLTSAALLVMLTAAAPAELPLQSFESLAAGQTPGAPWQSSGAALTVTDLVAATGEHAVQLPSPQGTTPMEAAIPLMLGADTPGFVDLWLKPVARTLGLHPDGHPAAGQPVESSGVLYLDGAQFLFQRHANRYSVVALTRSSTGAAQWLRLGGFAGAPPDFEIEDSGGRAKDWLRLTVRRDLNAGTYDVWLNQRLVGVDLALDRIPGAPEFRLQHRPTTHLADGTLLPMLLDDLQAGPGHPLYADSDRDAMPDFWEAAHERQIDPSQPLSLDVITPDRGADLDFDLVPKISEYFFGSHPTQADSDGDGLPDGVEIQHGLNPASRADAALDKDGDGFTNLAEFQGQGNGNISQPPAGALTNVVYVKGDHEGVQNGQYATPYRSLGAALASPYLTAGGRVVVRGEGGALHHFASNWVTPAGNSALTISRPVMLVGVNGALVHLQEMAPFATVSIPATSSGPVLTCENIAFEGCLGDDGGAFRIVGTPGEVVFRNCRFSGCWATDDGGALYAHAARIKIEDCWFESCWSGGEGGAVHVEAGSQLTVRRTHFQSNDASTDGGAVSGRGATSVPLGFESCVFLDNRARRGGALAAVEGADAALIQCTASSNLASLAGGGGGLFGGSTASVFSISGAIFWNNSANGANHAHVAGGVSTVTYTTLSGWTSAGGPAGTGNNGSDPVFRAGTVVPSAPAMQDSSNPAHNLLADFLNNPRWDAPGGTTGCLADRGAFERQPDSDADGLSDDWEARYGLNSSDPADADGDADQDGYSNLEEFNDKTDPRHSSSAKAPVIFVSASSGRDWHPGPNPPSGTVAAASQGTRSHPFQSIRRAILACPVNRRIVLLDGTFSGPANTNLKLSESWSWRPHLATTNLTSTLSLDGKTIRGLNGAGRVTLDGGGTARIFDLALSAGSISSSVTLQNLALRRGVADVGGAIRAVGSPGVGLLTLQGCVLSANRATSAGGAIHVTGASLHLQKSTLAGNDAPRGGAVALVNLAPIGVPTVSTASFSQCRFAYNLAPTVNGTLGQGGAVSSQASSFTTFQSRFDFNHAQRHGGALAILSSCGYYPPSFGSGTTFESNSAVLRGGGLYSENTCFMTTGCTFTGNQAGNSAASGEGGAIFLAHPATTTTTVLSYSSRSPQLVATRFVGNLAGLRGGALAVSDTSPLLTNCAFVENQADLSSGRGGAVAVFWETAQTNAPLVPAHPSAPRFIHATFTRNRASLATTLHAEPLTVPWLINGLISEGGLSSTSPSLTGPRQLYGCHLSAADGPLSHAESDPARRNQLATPSLAFDLLHLASPVRVPSDTTSTTGGVEPSSAATFTRPTSDIDGESRPAAAPGKFTLMRGCDEPRDADNDSLPDWFELLAAAFSPLDAVITTAHTHPVTPTSPTLATAKPTNNADADAYTLTQELLNFGRPDSPESDTLGRDSDGDGLSDIFERLTPGLDWLNPDVNGDGVLDGWAYRHYRSVNFDLLADDDHDGISNVVEAGEGLNPTNGDTDGDGVPDAWELATGSNPRDPDSDDDGIQDIWVAIPLNAAGKIPAGLHQPSPDEPWYVEQTWSNFDFNPGSYFYPSENSLWGLDTMNTTNDSFMEISRPFSVLENGLLTNSIRKVDNTLGPQLMMRPVDKFAFSIDAIATHQSEVANPVYTPKTNGFSNLSHLICDLMGQPPTPEWAARWYAQAVKAHGYGLAEQSMGRARQRWVARPGPNTVEHTINRFVPSFRLRTTRRGGATNDITMTFLRVRGRAAQVTYIPATGGSSVVEYPLAENDYSFETVTLNLPRGAQVGNVVKLDPQQRTQLSMTPPSVPTKSSENKYFDLIQFDVLLPIEVKDNGRTLLSESLQAERWTNANIQKQVHNDSIAWITGSTGDGGSPEMPVLSAEIHGAPKELNVRWRFECEYKRGNGYRASYVRDFTRDDDWVGIPNRNTQEFTANMPATQVWEISSSDEWINEIGQRGFFGGLARVFLKVDGRRECELCRFRIGGQNPASAAVESYLQTQAGPTFWYAYAIARHETFGRVPDRFYNHFYTEHHPANGRIGANANDMGWVAWAKGWPLYNLDRTFNRRSGYRQNGPGGYGVFQLTLGPKLPDGNQAYEQFISRSEIWNWQANCRRAIEEIRSKQVYANRLNQGLMRTYGSWGALPHEGSLTGLEAITVTYYNGTAGLPTRQIGGRKQRTPWTAAKTVRNGRTVLTWLFHQNINNYCNRINSHINN